MRKNILLTILLVSSSAIIFGGGTYAYLNKMHSDEKNNLNAQIKTLNDKIDNLELEKNSIGTIKSSDTDSLLQLCQTSNPGLTCVIDKVEGNYATGSASDPNGGVGGFAWFAKKQNDQWVIVEKGLQDDPSCIATQGFPQSIVPSCIDRSISE